MFLQVLSEKLPELLDFPKDLSSLELAAKVSIKCSFLAFGHFKY
jgi:hypothetical protein